LQQTNPPGTPCAANLIVHSGHFEVNRNGGQVAPDSVPYFATLLHDEVRQVFFVFEANVID